jgi:hypothetical protein
MTEVLGIEEFRQALQESSINVKKHKEVLREENLDALRSVGANEQILDFFSEFSFDEELEIGAFSLREANCLKKDLAWDDVFKSGLNHDLLIMGSGISGDMLVLDLRCFQTGILFLDHFDPDDSEDQRKFVINMQCSLGQFYLNSVKIDDYPIDAYEAAVYMNSPFTGYTDM